MSLISDDTDEQDMQDIKDKELLEDLLYKSFFIGNFKLKSKDKKKSKKYLKINERFNFSNKSNYKYNNNSFKNINNYSLNLKKETIDDYKYFLNIYYNLLYFNNIKFLNNNNIYYLKIILLNQYKLDLIKLIKFEQNLFRNVIINDYNYYYLNKEINYNYQLIKFKKNNL